MLSSLTEILPIYDGFCVRAEDAYNIFLPRKENRMVRKGEIIYDCLWYFFTAVSINML